MRNSMTSLDNAHRRIARRLLATRGPSGRVISDDQFQVMETGLVAILFLLIWAAAYGIFHVEWTLGDVHIAHQWVPRLIMSSMAGVFLGMTMHWLKINDAAEGLVYLGLEWMRCGLPLDEEKATEIERLCRLPEPHAFSAKLA